MDSPTYFANGIASALKVLAVFHKLEREVLKFWAELLRAS